MFPIILTHTGSLKKMEITVFFDSDGLNWMISVGVSAVSPRPDFTVIMTCYKKKKRVNHETCRTYSLLTHFTFASFGSNPVWIHPSLILAFIFISTAYLWSFLNASQTVVILSHRQNLSAPRQTYKVRTRPGSLTGLLKMCHKNLSPNQSSSIRLPKTVCDTEYKYVWL